MCSQEKPQHYDPVHTKVGVIGLGYVGLPLALLFTKKGYHVTGIDIDATKVASLQQASSYIPDIENRELAQVLATNKLTFAADYSGIEDLDIIVICVPTPLASDNKPDLRYLKHVSEDLYPRLQEKQLVIVESSTYPGTTREVIQPILEKSNLIPGKTLHLAYSPERIDPGNKSLSIEEVPKIISGLSEQCLMRITAFYERVFNTIVPASSLEVAELAKLLENSYRFINISFINEMAMFCDKLGIDLWEAIATANTKPYGYQAFYPGPGIGGHCIPIDPLYLYWVGAQRGFHTQFLSLSEQMNQTITSYVIEQIKKLAETDKPISDAAIVLYGLSYKKDSNDVRSSPALDIMKALIQTGANVSYHDPHVPSVEVGQTLYSSQPLTKELLENADLVAILTDHSNLPITSILEHAKVVYDTKNVTKGYKGKAKTVVLGDGGTNYLADGKS
ncbi:nucleotide sugar dehydrogenase [Shouchella clausii]|uniref:nucleotide sugar dehydrogenase n=1 Tax=Shouchella clausii TaxID=79880 RepID=UPI0027005ECE|nr:nucleotide sugar dehydrogenase [Shouchella clausii]MDO7268988.1 nucleotide sugar dehydrogenase [Shouchella clausii]MDO7288795.1 nucleotide sugar dehydrogenase [Shouchella clausii]